MDADTPDAHSPNLTSSDLQAAALPESPSSGELAEALASELAANWRRGQRIRAEDFLGRYPDVAQDTGIALRLIYEEICLRQENGETGISTDLFGRFPQWHRDLEALLDCQGAVSSRVVEFPQVGECLGEFHIVAELGRGGRGRVFLAEQPSLADRPVVLKLAPLEGGEHRTLAQLQHAHIVPLYFAPEFPSKGLRGLCMPDLGGLTLAELLQQLVSCPPSQRTGQALLEALQRARRPAGMTSGVRGPVRGFLAAGSFAQAACWLAACLADALQYAHERGLLHLDVKPANVLLTAEGQPMLLDFHLAREPLAQGPAPGGWLGGTPGYLATEQQAALEAMLRGEPIPTAVDARADVYALGLVLYELLGGTLPLLPAAEPVDILRRNSQVSQGLADIVARCLAPDPADRYPSAGLLAADLRRHLADLPLQGVPNRSVVERWRKWRRRRPHAAGRALVSLALVLTAALVGWQALTYRNQRVRDAQSALAEGQRLIKRHQYAEAAWTLLRSRTHLRKLPWTGNLDAQLAAGLEQAQRGEAAEALHTLVEELRFLDGAATTPVHDMDSLLSRCRGEWQRWRGLLQRGAVPWPEQGQQRLRMDLIDLILLWSDMEVRFAPEAQRESAQQLAREIHAEAEALLSGGLALNRVPHLRPWDLDQSPGRPGPKTPSPRTPWEHYLLGRSLLHSGNLLAAREELAQAVAQRPNDFWSNFSCGICCYRLQRQADALAYFHACVVLAPDCAECYYNRALAYRALGDRPSALHDYDRALALKPHLIGASLGRGLLHLECDDYGAAIVDLNNALVDGAEATPTLYQLALAYAAHGDPVAARNTLARALGRAPTQDECKELERRLGGKGTPTTHRYGRP